MKFQCRKTVITYLYFAAMFLITGDRLIATMLSLQHKILCTTFKTKWMIAIVWVFILSSTFTIYGYYYTKYGILWMYVDELYEVLVFLVPAVLTVLYSVFVIVCYLLMFLRYIQSKRSSTSPYLSSFELFRKSKFYHSSELE